MSSMQRTLWLLLTIALAVCSCLYALSFVVTSPGHVFMSLGGDAVKNYYTYLYHILYDKGIWFHGMNYPYGEHIVFTDAQPLLSVPLSYLKGITAEQALATMHLLIGLSYILAVVFVYKILLYFKVRPLLAVLFALLVVFFSPQVMRIMGHYAMAYQCFIPMLFYWTIRYNDTGYQRYPVYVFVMGCIASFLHLYFAATILLWVALYSVGSFLFKGLSFKKCLWHVLPILLSAIGVFVVVSTTMKMTDPYAADRSQMPYGILEHTTRLKQIFTSGDSPIWKYVRETKTLLGKEVSEGGEGQTYPGMVVLMMVVGSFVALMIKRRKQKKQNIPFEGPQFANIWLFIGFAALLVAMGVPFVWGMERLLDYVSAFRQFRSFGRFSWIFYYVVAIYTVVLINYWYGTFMAKKKTFAAYGIVCSALLLWCYETHAYVGVIRDAAFNGYKKNYKSYFSKEEKSWNDFLQEHGYKSTDFQAIILLPYFNVGSEKLWVHNDAGWLFFVASKASMQLRLPMVDVMMSRTAWTQTENLARTAAGPYADKPLFRETRDDKPYLLIVSDVVTPDQQYLADNSVLIGEYPDCKVYVCDPKKIKATDAKLQQEAQTIAAGMQPGDTCVVNKGEWYVNHYDDVQQPADKVFFGKGAVPPIDKDDSLWVTIPVQPKEDNQLYEFSVWLLHSRVDYRSPYVTLEFVDSSNNVIFTKDALTKESTDNYGLWFRDFVFVNIPAACRGVRCHLYNSEREKKHSPSYLSMDEMMLRPADALIISKDANGAIMVNNHHLR